MRILLDCRPLQARGADPEKSRYILSCCSFLAREKSVEWLCLVDHAFGPGMVPGLAGLSDLPGCRLLIRRAIPGWLGNRIWYRRQIPRWVRQQRADLYMSTGGQAAALSVPQVLWMPASVNNYPSGLLKGLVRATAIFCFSDSDRAFLIGQTSSEIRQKISVLPFAPDDLAAPLSLSAKQSVQEQFAENREFFLASAATASLTDLVSLLRAFSLFKKRQLSNMRLLVEVIDPGDNSALAEKLATYKYRADVHVIGDQPQEDRMRMLAAAYALLLPVAGEIPAIALINAWKARVPVISCPDNIVSAMAGDAALYADPANPVELSEQLMLLYKDEAVRLQLIKKGLERLGSLDGRHPGTTVWEAIKMPKIS